MLWSYRATSEPTGHVLEALRGLLWPMWDGTSRDVKVQSFCVGPVVCVLTWVFLAACARRRVWVCLL